MVYCLFHTPPLKVKKIIINNFVVYKSNKAIYEKWKIDFKISLDSKLAKITGWKENSIRHLNEVNSQHNTPGSHKHNGNRILEPSHIDRN